MIHQEQLMGTREGLEVFVENMGSYVWYVMDEMVAEDSNLLKLFSPYYFVMLQTG